MNRIKLIIKQYAIQEGRDATAWKELLERVAMDRGESVEDIFYLAECALVELEMENKGASSA